MIKFSHGGDIYSQKVDYDFSANINPLGMPESVKRILSRKSMIRALSRSILFRTR